MNLDFSLSFSTRIQLVLPPWFGSVHPNLDARITGAAAVYAAVAQQIISLLPFTRLKTNQGELLDLAAYDFTGANITRNAGENDEAFSARLRGSLFTTSGTRLDFIRQITTALGAPPVIFDPRQPNDTGTVGNVSSGVVPTLFYGSRGGLTSYKLGYQWFVTLNNSVAMLSNSQIYALINMIMPAGTVCWTHILNSPDPGPGSVAGFWNQGPGWGISGWITQPA